MVTLGYKRYGHRLRKGFELLVWREPTKAHILTAPRAQAACSGRAMGKLHCLGIPNHIVRAFRNVIGKDLWSVSLENPLLDLLIRIA